MVKLMVEKKKEKKKRKEVSKPCMKDPANRETLVETSCRLGDERISSRNGGDYQLYNIHTKPFTNNQVGDSYQVYNCVHVLECIKPCDICTSM